MDNNCALTSIYMGNSLKSATEKETKVLYTKYLQKSTLLLSQLLVENPKSDKFNLGIVHFYNHNLHSNPSDSLDYFIKGSEVKYGKSPYYVGLIYEKGIGVKSDKTIAAQWYEKGAKLGDSFSMVKFGKHLMSIMNWDYFMSKSKN